jgi:phospholipid/cholesterol/gamma-HCH transport system substrate-binding protein
MKVRLIAIIVVALGILYWGVYMVSRDVARGYSRIIVVLPSADGVREGAAVSYLGLSIGVVDHLELHDGRAVVEVRLQRQDVDLRTGDVVRLKTLGILGDRQLEIVPGPPSAPPMRAGDTLFAMPQSPR